MKPVRYFAIISNANGAAILQVIISAAILSSIFLASVQMTTLLAKQSVKVRGSSSRDNYERQILALFSSSTLCSCNLGVTATTDLAVPDNGSVTVTGLRSSCGSGTNDFYQSSPGGFSIDPALNVADVTILNATQTSPLKYSAILNVHYSAPVGSNVNIKDGQFLFLFNETTATGSPHTIDHCQVSGPYVPPDPTQWLITGNSPTGAYYVGTNDGGDFYFERNSIMAGALRGNQTSLGVNTLVSSSGNSVVAVGASALQANTNGSFDAALGFQSLQRATGNWFNTAIGTNAMQGTADNYGTAVGANALMSATNINFGLAVGTYAGQSMTNAGDPAIGWKALGSIVNGNGRNSAFGYGAMSGVLSTNSGSAFGYNSMQSLTTGNNNSAIGSNSLLNTTTGVNNVVAGAQAMIANTTGSSNTAVGNNALVSNTTGSWNSALGANALQNNTTGNSNAAMGWGALAANLTGSNNSALGQNALAAATANNNSALGWGALAGSSTGTSNSAMGWNAAANTTVGNNITAVGAQALQSNTTGNNLTAIGSLSLKSHLTGDLHTAIGYAALSAQTSATGTNTAVGAFAMGSGNSGGYNVALGNYALQNFGTGSENTAVTNLTLQQNSTGNQNTAFGGLNLNTSGSNNTSVGATTLASNSTANGNTGIGFNSLNANTTGSENTAMGPNSLSWSNGSYNVAVGPNAGTANSGVNALALGDKNTFIGGNTGVVSNLLSYSYATAVGYGTIVGASNAMVLGSTAATFVGIGLTNPTYELQLSTDSAFLPGSNTWTVFSDARLKDVRAPYKRGLNEILAIEPIYYHYKKDNALALPSDKEFVGIIAQQAQAVIPESVSVDAKGYLHLVTDSIFWAILNAIKELFHIWQTDSSGLHAKLNIEGDHLLSAQTAQTRIDSDNELIRSYLCKKDSSAAFCDGGSSK